MNLIAWFHDLEDNNLELTAGGKGASLCRMIKGGFPIPEGYVLCADMFGKFMEQNKLWDTVFSKLDAIDWSNDESLQTTGEELRGMIESAPMPMELQELIISYYRELGENAPVAVRSSGTAEDLEDASFAGQQETYLYVIGEEDLINKVKACWASLYNDCAIFYRREKSFDEREISIAVVVQRMVNADKAGVMFSAHPITKERSHVMIEAAWGLGEGVVQGIVNPDNYVIEKSGYGVILNHVPEKEIMVVKASERGGSKEVPVPFRQRHAPVLSIGERNKLVDLAMLVEKFYGKPQDLEWAYEKTKLYLLQSRPITTLDAEG